MREGGCWGFGRWSGRRVEWGEDRMGEWGWRFMDLELGGQLGEFEVLKE